MCLCYHFFGTRALHILHYSLKRGSKASDCGVKKVLEAMFQIFQEHPSQKEGYERTTQQ